MEKGFVENIKKEERYLTALAFKLSSSRDDALDLIQETWLRIMRITIIMIIAISLGVGLLL